MQGITGVNERYRLKMTIIEEGVFCANSVNYLLPDEKMIEYILGLGNSHLLNWFFKKLSTNSNVNGYEVDNLPVADGDSDLQYEIVNVVNQLLSTVNENSKLNIALEEQLNSLVYLLYELSEDEIAEVEKVYDV